MRIGHGYDVHAFGAGDHIVLGGVRIEHSQGLVAHSDGDVVFTCALRCLTGRCRGGGYRQTLSG